ncbi:MAG: biopolymer transporter ExbD [Candidatus Contendobacter sp.]|jgi:biopolymer transport protein ExbD|nr:biopolymer transporter ExbD [Gammaproteobacteria bacterium]MCC8994434.1 biopolymer transporter ExbD [Candidatus Contendobacter sp.]
MAFGSFQHSRHAQPVAEINTTPLVDVMLVLLVIFMLTLPLITHQLAVNLPETDAQVQSTPTETVIVEVGIAADGLLLWNGIALAEADFEQRLQAAAHTESKPELHLYADKNTPYQRLAEVMAAAQRHGLTRIGFITTAKAP